MEKLEGVDIIPTFLGMINNEEVVVKDEIDDYIKTTDLVRKP
jgi:hypothetical protein